MYPTNIACALVLNAHVAQAVRVALNASVVAEKVPSIVSACLVLFIVLSIVVKVVRSAKVVDPLITGVRAQNMFHDCCFYEPSFVSC